MLVSGDARVRIQAIGALSQAQVSDIPLTVWETVGRGLEGLENGWKRTQVKAVLRILRVNVSFCPSN